jgi:hypothetical protein
MRSWMALFVVGILVGPVVGSPAALAESPPVPDEVRSIVEASYDQWYDSLGVRQTCSSAVTITYEEIAGRRGEYRTRTGQVAIDPTDSTDGLAAIVIHELSHHTFLACGAFADDDFTASFYGSQGLPEDRDWFDYAAGWSATPAEHFAEAMAFTIHGSGEGGIPVDPETTALVSRWLAGAPSTPPAKSHDPAPFSALSTGLEKEEGAMEPGGLPAAGEPTQSTQSELTVSAAELAIRASVRVFALTRGLVQGPI